VSGGGRESAILVTLSAVCLPGPDGPVAAPHIGLDLARLASLGQPVIVTGPELFGRRLPPTGLARERWLKAVLATPATIRVADLAVPPAAPRDGDHAAAACAAWIALRRHYSAAWLVTDRREDTTTAHRAGLAVVQVGGPAGDSPASGRPDIRARDLTDAVHQLLTRDAFVSLSTA
jgi:hypothetical protein